MRTSIGKATLRVDSVDRGGVATVLQRSDLDPALVRAEVLSEHGGGSVSGAVGGQRDENRVAFAAARILSIARELRHAEPHLVSVFDSGVVDPVELDRLGVNLCGSYSGCRRGRNRARGVRGRCITAHIEADHAIAYLLLGLRLIGEVSRVVRKPGHRPRRSGSTDFLMRKSTPTAVHRTSTDELETGFTTVSDALDGTAGDGGGIVAHTVFENCDTTAVLPLT